MESFQISTDLIDDKKQVDNNFGNMKFFKQGSICFNRKMIGLYITILIKFSTFSMTILLISKLFEKGNEDANKLIWTIIISISSFIVFFQMIYVGFSNPGFFKPGKRNLEIDSTIRKYI